jgi:hypothetical protein
MLISHNQSNYVTTTPISEQMKEQDTIKRLSYSTSYTSKQAITALKGKCSRWTKL